RLDEQHLCGNVRQWIISGVGGEADIRDRPKEFSDRSSMLKAELIRRLDEVTGKADAVLAGMTDKQLLQRHRIQEFDEAALSAIFDSLSHFRGHQQEIVYINQHRPVVQVQPLLEASRECLLAAMYACPMPVEISSFMVTLRSTQVLLALLGVHRFGELPTLTGSNRDPLPPLLLDQPGEVHDLAGVVGHMCQRAEQGLVEAVLLSPDQYRLLKLVVAKARQG